jgi:hypothetical protein
MFLQGKWDQYKNLSMPVGFETQNAKEESRSCRGGICAGGTLAYDAWLREALDEQDSNHRGHPAEADLSGPALQGI